MRQFGKHPRALISFLFLALASCASDKSENQPQSQESTATTADRVPLPKRRKLVPARFERLDPKSTGISLRHAVDTSHPLKRLYTTGHVCGGVALGDVDGDGRLDIFLVVNNGENRLYRQVAEFRFEDITEQAGIGGGADAWGSGAALADIDGDGDLDIYVCNYDRANQLFINEGKTAETDVRFVERAAAFGLDLVDACVMPSFCDYDNDGDLDVYVVCYRYERAGGWPPQNEIYDVVNGRAHLKPGLEKYYGLAMAGAKTVYVTTTGRWDYLMRNQGADETGQIRYSDVSDAAGIFGRGMGLSAVWWDYDQDGLPDLYVANDFEFSDRLYHNSGDGTFTERIKEVIPHTAYYAMGSAAGDINNDGLEDFFVADMAGTSHYKAKMSMGDMEGKQKLTLDFSEPRQMMRNALYVNTGLGRMQEAAFLAGVAKSDWSWAPKLVDFDEDGRVDLFITNGMSRDLTNSDMRPRGLRNSGMTEWAMFEDTPPRREPNLAFRNKGDLAFENVSAPWHLDHNGMSFAAACGDLDGDGDMDMVVCNLDEPVSVYRNNSADGHRVVIRLKGLAPNTHAIGAQVRLESKSGIQMRTMRPQSGFLASDEPVVHFGLGSDERIDSLLITWPDGRRQELHDLPVDHRFIISASSNSDPSATKRPATPAALALFRSSDVLAGTVHEETIYDDFIYQPLLPNKLSQLGPGMAWGDVDGDGDDDLYVGGAAKHAGRLFLSGGPESFTAASVEDFEKDRAAEDMAAVFFDADGDDDLDLYVVSGSYEFPVGHPALADRLYLNDGSGRFSKAPAGALPAGTLLGEHDCGSIVAAGDFDRDGDLDLFVGSRLVPRKYPLAPESRLLVNETAPGATPAFVDRTDDIAPGLKTTGLVTGALWSDVDLDGWIDLLVTHEWGPVKFYKNRGGRLEDQTAAAGLAELSGWYNGIAGRDLDGDGDIDYVVSNFGLNTKYKATAKKPAMLYYGDFAGDGNPQLVEAKYERDVLLPVRGKSCSSDAMPHLAQSFTTFDSFAVSSLAEIYTNDCLEDAEKFVATNLESGVLLNVRQHGSEGDGDQPVRFEFHPLPRLAQISPAFGIALTEVNGDGHADLYLVHNFHGPQRETGRMDGGMSLLMTGNGDGTFTPLTPASSGLVVPGDAKSLTVADVNNDNKPDLIVSVNNGPVRTFVHTGRQPRAILKVKLIGPVGNPAAIGARVVLDREDGTRQTAEVSAGSGYLSQSSAALYFGLGHSATCQEITVHWPDGAQSQHPFNKEWSATGACTIHHPDR